MSRGRSSVLLHIGVVIRYVLPDLRTTSRLPISCPILPMTMFTVFFYDQYTRFITSHVRSARYCDQHAYLSVCLSVCLFMNIIFGFVWSLSTFTDYIYLLTYFFLSQKPDVQTIHQIVCACHVAVVRSSCISAL